jgi:hypothetical protein
MPAPERVAGAGPQLAGNNGGTAPAATSGPFCTFPPEMALRHAARLWYKPDSSGRSGQRSPFDRRSFIAQPVLDKGKPAERPGRKAMGLRSRCPHTGSRLPSCRRKSCQDLSSAPRQCQGPPPNRRLRQRARTPRRPDSRGHPAPEPGLRIPRAEHRRAHARG